MIKNKDSVQDLDPDPEFMDPEITDPLNPDPQHWLMISCSKRILSQPTEHWFEISFDMSKDHKFKKTSTQVTGIGYGTLYVLHT